MTKKHFVIQAVAFILAWIAVPFLLACDKGCEEHEGVCACSAVPEQAVQAYVPSDEKPPRSGRPSYEAEGVHVDMPTSSKSSETISDDLGKNIPNGGVPQK